MLEAKQPPDAIAVAKRLARSLESGQHEYALGGAIALGYWGLPRGTLDVDLTLFVSVEQPSQCIAVLQDIGCEFSILEVTQSLRDHGFCRATCDGIRVDVFVPLVPFYEAARMRRKRVLLEDQPVTIWDAETLSVFKMMFFRRKDLADVEQILRTQGAGFDRTWVRDQLADMYGLRDPRLSQWDDLVAEVAADSQS